MLDSKSLIQDDSAKISKEITVTEIKIIDKKVLISGYVKLFTELPSTAVNALIVNTEQEIAGLEEQAVTLRISLAAEKTIDKQDFLKKLDLVSYENK